MDEIKRVLNMYQSNDDKIDFLLRQLEMALKEKEHYKSHIERGTDNERK